MLATFPSEPITFFRSSDKHFRVKWRLEQEWKERELDKQIPSKPTQTGRLLEDIHSGIITHGNSCFMVT